MVRFRADIKGGKEIAQALKLLPVGARKNVARKMTRGGAAVLGKAIRAAAPRGKSKNLKRGIKWRQRNDRYDGRVIGLVYVDYRVAPHFHLIESGTVARRHKKTGKGVGRVKGSYFAERTVRLHRTAAVQSMVFTAGVGLHQETLKVFRRAAGIKKKR